MFDATSPSEVFGQAEIGVAADAAGTRLARLHQQAPLRVLFPTPAVGDVFEAALVTTSGGLVGGDRLAIAVHAGRDARILVSPQAAEKVYRSTGADCRIEVALTAEHGSWLEWLPQETILFEGARLDRMSAIEADADARVLAGEIVVFGRIGRGERFSRGFLRDGWQVRRNGRLVWADALLLEHDIARQIDHPAGLAGAVAAATAIYVAPDAAEHLAAARDLGALATVVNGVLVMRWLKKDARAVRAEFGAIWSGFRAAVAGLPRRLPRLWHV